MKDILTLRKYRILKTNQKLKRNWITSSMEITIKKLKKKHKKHYLIFKRINQLFPVNGLKILILSIILIMMYEAPVDKITPIIMSKNTNPVKLII